jgi:DNA-binding CsgD family transcriptional regulator
MQYMALLRERKQDAELSLRHLRKDFGGLMENKFQRWGLSPAEKDISVLILKGLGTFEISEIRSTKLGTVKLQVHKILQKAGASNRAEFMSLFLDDFLDLGAESV